MQANHYTSPQLAPTPQPEEQDFLTASMRLNYFNIHTDQVKVDLRGDQYAKAGPAESPYRRDFSVATYIKESNPTITIFVRTVRNGESLTFELSPDSFVQDLMKKVSAKVGLHENEFYLQYGGRVLQAGLKLCSYGIVNYSTIDMNGRVRGG